MLTERGLAPALQSVADRAPVPVELDVQLPERLAPAHEAALYFTACEALANVSKHAQASRASIRARQENGSVVIEIADDGVGGAEPSRGWPARAERPARCGRGHAARRERRRSRHPRDRDATGRRGGSRLTTSTVTCNLQVTMNSKLTMMTTGAVADAAAPSLVAIARGGRGSGVVLTPGRVLVGTHGVRAERLAISRGDGDVVPATLLAHDADRSLAVLAADTADAPPLPWPDADPAPQLGDDVVALARPSGRPLHATRGAIAAIGERLRGPRGRLGEPALVHTAPLPRGAAGSPLLAADGRLLGFSTARLDGGFLLALRHRCAAPPFPRPR